MRLIHRAALRRPLSRGAPTLPGRNSGIALIAVLLLLALLTLLASAAATLSVSHRRIAERFAQSTLTIGDDDSAIRIALLRAFAAPRNVTQIPIAETQMLTLFGSTVDVVMTREVGRVDLNTGSTDILTALFAANGLTHEFAQAMADRIVRYRQSLLAEGRAPAFQSVAELRLIPGADRLSPELVDAFTVYSQADVPVVAAAAPPVQRALIWADRYQLGGHRWLPDAFTPQVDNATVEPATLIGEVIRIKACSEKAEWAPCRVATVRLTGSVRKPLQVLEWRSDLGGTRFEAPVLSAKAAQSSH